MNWRDPVNQSSYLPDADANLIAAFESECIRRDYSGAGHQETSKRKADLAIEEFDKHRRVAL
jgi:hypothetical protein